MGKYVCLRNCFVNVQLWKKDKVYELPDSMDKDPKNFRPVGVPAELHEEATEDERNEEHEAKLKVANKPEHIPEGHYWCTDCQKTHNGNPNKKTGKVGRMAKKHLKFRAE
ncbi:hypothetical protein LCGC14_2100650 [marine sediment metagenome]|uniref:Uncharacterized protein n=1 Tax=marine sediment metagenome TaxID=412755 RepID=A0A0F9EXA9_9ZZZZ